ncbi:MAG: pheromone autoinducer 2 transporter [bacterium ADurb.Bin243]|nr:MAG: pheromone autoinducer 2 transporter [bacterium ADurb.Bin243]HOD39211.1 AI-2E family transporter [Candidatus Wallbacteria bacterium]
MKDQKLKKSNEEQGGGTAVPPAEVSASSEEKKHKKVHEETLASMTGISFSGENSSIIVLALPSNFLYYIKRVLLPVLVMAGLVSVYYLSSILMLFVVSFFFAYVLNPLVLLVEKYLKNKTVSILSVYLVLFSLFLLLIIPAVTNIVSEISDLGNKMQRYSESFKGMYRNFIHSVQKSGTPIWLGEIEKYLSSFIETPDNGISKDAALPETVNGVKRDDTVTVNGYEVNLVNYSSSTGEVLIANTSEITLNYINKLNYFLKHSPKVEAFIMSVFEMLKDNLLNVSSAILIGLMNLTAILIHYALVPLLGYYFLADFKNLWAGFQNSIPDKFKNQTVRLVGQLDEVLGTFLRGQLVICLIVGTAFSFALFFIGVDFAFIIGPISGIFNIIYYLGPAMALVPSLIIALLKWGLTFKALYKMIFIITAILVIHIIDAFMFQPFIAEKSFSMHPLTLMLLLFIGFQLQGLLGMFIAIPLYGVGKVIYNNFKIVYV